MRINKSIPGICQRGIPIPTATWAAGRFTSAIHSVTGCSTLIKVTREKLKTLHGC